jgi:hypothetical protein
VAIWATSTRAQQQPSIPLAEHPRPDFERSSWQNLNGPWQFRFDPHDAGEEQSWQEGLTSTRTITVPFPWGSPLSGVPDSADIGWYQRTITVPNAWSGERVFLVVGAADWRTTAWLDGQKLGTHQGGYTPFEFELTDYARPGTRHRLVLRIDDAPRTFTLQGKQGYGNARGIWQTPYLEARGSTPMRTLHFTPRLSNDKVTVAVGLLEPATQDLTFSLRFDNGEVSPITRSIPKGTRHISIDVALPHPHLWTLDDPYLYEVSASASGAGIAEDRVHSYFGMRSISVVNLPGTDDRYVALNGEPLYLQLTLDQGYHQGGFYTFPSDSFEKAEILRAKRIGLTGLREHVKVVSPRRLYWADRLGLLIVADVPNSWGEPDSAMHAEVDSTLRQMIARDYNHPAIFAWVLFNETWGLLNHVDGKDIYRPDTQQWVVSLVHAAKALDSTRLVEDNSVCCGRGHTATDINSWHSYLPGWAWPAHLDSVSNRTFPGSTWNFEPGYQQGEQPDINSEFGNVWGYEGSTGDVDWSWDYHRALNAFRRHPRIAGWLYTEYADVINEWNGYWRFDRTPKETGFGELVAGMSLSDLNSPLYIAVGSGLSEATHPLAHVAVPVYASFLTGNMAYGDTLRLVADLYGWNSVGEKHTYFTTSRAVPFHPWMTQPLDPLELTMPSDPAVLVLAVRLEDAAGGVLQRNFCTFVVEGDPPAELATTAGHVARLIRIDPARFSNAQWSLTQWDVMGGVKVNGAGSGYFEYRVPWPTGTSPDDLASVTLVAEVSAKQLFSKDRANRGNQQGDFMLGQGTHDPSLNPNAYPMTDETRFPSAVTVRVNGIVAGRRQLADDPADSRGILSWHYQLRDGKLREAGSYGELLHVAIPRQAIEGAARTGEFVIRLEVSSAFPGGLAIYGRRFGRYPLDPTLVLMPRR